MEMHEPTRWPNRWKDDPSVAAGSEGAEARAAALIRGLRPTPSLGDRAVDGLLLRLHENALATSTPPEPGLLSFAQRRWRIVAAGASALIGLNLAFAGVTVYRARVQRQEAATAQAARAQAKHAGSRSVAPSQASQAPLPPVPVLVPESRVVPAARASAHLSQASVADSLSREAALVSRGLTELREGGDVTGALGTLQGYLARYPAGALRSEAEAGELDALLRLGRKGDALGLLDGLAVRGFAGVPRAGELRVLRGELLAEQGRCSEALGSFASPAGDEAVRERALYGQAVCRARLGDSEGSRRDFEQLLAAFPGGAHAEAARQALR
jgi:hypothetical protein